jgi:hypothetical protein
MVVEPEREFIVSIETTSSKGTGTRASFSTISFTDRENTISRTGPYLKAIGSKVYNSGICLNIIQKRFQAPFGCLIKR